MNKLKVGDHMSRDVVTIDRDASIHDAIEKMLEHKIHGLIAVDQSGRPAGILTTNDVLALIDKGESGSDTLVSEFMSSPLITIDPDYDLHKAVGIMLKNRIHRLPVVKDKKLVGMLTGSDIMRVFKRMRK